MTGTKLANKADNSLPDDIDRLIKAGSICNLAVYLSQVYSNGQRRSLKSLESTIKTEGEQISEKLDYKQNTLFNKIIATAHLLYLDFDGAFEYYKKNNDLKSIRNSLDLALLHGRVDPALKMAEALAKSKDITCSLDYRLTEEHFIKAIQNTPLETDGENYFLDEDSLKFCLNTLGKERGFLKNVVRDMYDSKSLDSPRKFLLSLYSGDDELIGISKEEFKSKKGKRKQADRIAKSVSDENGLKITGKIQEGDDNDFYPLSSNIYLAKKESMQFVIKENIKYKIDFSSIDGYNIEKELYEDIISHNSAPGFYGTLKKEGLEFLVLEFCKGEILTKYTSENNLLSIEHTIGIISQAAEFLGYLHSQGIIYGDMKDKNLVYDGRRVKVLDFGMSNMRIKKEGTTGEDFVYNILSNAEYACPETIISSKVYKKSDTFQLGILFYKLLTGRHPFADGKASEDYTEKESELMGFSLPNYWNNASFENLIFVKNPKIKYIVSRMLEKDYRMRPSVLEVYTALDKLGGG